MRLEQPQFGEPDSGWNVPQAAIHPIENWSFCATFSGIKWEIFYSLRKAQIVTEQWRKHYNNKRLHRARILTTRTGIHYHIARNANHA
jgi:hypothetical protein